MPGPATRPPRRRTQVSRRRVVLGTLAATSCLGLPASAAHADQTVHLKATFQGRQATATIMVPDDWEAQGSGRRVKLTAPASRKGCDHVLRLDLGLLYVASTVTSSDWVTSRLTGNGPVVAGGTGDYSWGVAARTGWRSATGAGAVVAGNGRFGRIMSEVRASSGLTEDCTTAQAAPAAKRLSRVLQSLTIAAVARRKR